MIRPADWTPHPWKNGRGVTYEVLREPATGDYDLRISVGIVDESGPFSTFPGYTRWSLLLDGGPIELDGVPLSGLVMLDGAKQIDAQLAAPARVLNILAKSARVGTGDRDDVDIVFDLVTHECRYTSRAVGDVVWIKR